MARYLLIGVLDVDYDRAEGSVDPMMTQTNSQDLYQNRNKSVAKSFFRQLKTEGFTHEQIIELSTTLLDLVTEDLREQVSPAIAK